jgi:calcineurin-like phosphoesterase family protein
MLDINLDQQEVWLTSDTHFSHAKTLDWYPNSRPYKGAEEMDSSMGAIWNSCVQPNDTLIHLGDVIFGDFYSWSQTHPLNGRKILVKGNHDSKMSSQSLSLFNKVFDYGVEARVILNGEKIHCVFNHYPFITWNKSHYGSYSMYGHTHSNEYDTEYRHSVCWDVWGRPVKLRDLLEKK